MFAPASRENTVPIAFGYWKGGKLVNIKYRRLDKKEFWQVRGAEKVFYGLDDTVGHDCVVIVEGEMDKLSFYEAGIPFAVSVPDGAPPKVKETVPRQEEDKKFEYLWACEEWLEDKTEVILATDADEPGQALAEELARRLGRERCRLVEWPKGGPSRDAVRRAEKEVEMSKKRLDAAR